MHSSTTRDVASENRLSDREIEEFFSLGWIMKTALFRQDEIARMKASFDELERVAAKLSASGAHRGSHFVLGRKNGKQVIKRVVWAGGSQPYLLEVGTDSRLIAPCAQLLESGVMDQLLSQAHFKRPGDGVIFGWHQDIQHRDKGNRTWTDVNGRGSFVQTLIAIDEMTADSGPLKFIPGSSAWGRVNFGDHDYDDSRDIAEKPPEFREEEAVTILAKPGDTLFFGPYTAHASFENTSRQYRRVLINGYAYPGANRREYPGDGSGRSIALKCPEPVLCD